MILRVVHRARAAQSAGLIRLMSASKPPPTVVSGSSGDVDAGIGKVKKQKKPIASGVPKPQPIGDVQKGESRASGQEESAATAALVEGETPVRYIRDLPGPHDGPLADPPTKHLGGRAKKQRWEEDLVTPVIPLGAPKEGEEPNRDGLDEAYFGILRQPGDRNRGAGAGEGGATGSGANSGSRSAHGSGGTGSGNQEHRGVQYRTRSAPLDGKRSAIRGGVAPPGWDDVPLTMEELIARAEQESNTISVTGKAASEGYKTSYQWSMDPRGAEALGVQDKPLPDLDHIFEDGIDDEEIISRLETEIEDLMRPEGAILKLEEGIYLDKDGDYIDHNGVLICRADGTGAMDNQTLLAHYLKLEDDLDIVKPLRVNLDKFNFGPSVPTAPVDLATSGSDGGDSRNNASANASASVSTNTSANASDSASAYAHAHASASAHAHAHASASGNASAAMEALSALKKAGDDSNFPSPAAGKLETDDDDESMGAPAAAAATNLASALAPAASAHVPSAFDPLPPPPTATITATMLQEASQGAQLTGEGSRPGAETGSLDDMGLSAMELDPADWLAPPPAPSAAPPKPDWDFAEFLAPLDRVLAKKGLVLTETGELVHGKSGALVRDRHGKVHLPNLLPRELRSKPNAELEKLGVDFVPGTGYVSRATKEVLRDAEGRVHKPEALPEVLRHDLTAILASHGLVLEKATGCLLDATSRAVVRDERYRVLVPKRITVKIASEIARGEEAAILDRDDDYPTLRRYDYASLEAAIAEEEEREAGFAPGETRAPGSSSSSSAAASAEEELANPDAVAVAEALVGNAGGSGPLRTAEELKEEERRAQEKMQAGSVRLPPEIDNTEVAKMIREAAKFYVTNDKGELVEHSAPLGDLDDPALRRGLRVMKEPPPNLTPVPALPEKFTKAIALVRALPVKLKHGFARNEEGETVDLNTGTVIMSRDKKVLVSPEMLAALILRQPYDEQFVADHCAKGDKPEDFKIPREEELRAQFSRKPVINPEIERKLDSIRGLAREEMERFPQGRNPDDFDEKFDPLAATSRADIQALVSGAPQDVTKGLSSIATFLTELNRATPVGKSENEVWNSAARHLLASIEGAPERLDEAILELRRAVEDGIKVAVPLYEPSSLAKRIVKQLGYAAMEKLVPVLFPLMDPRERRTFVAYLIQPLHDLCAKPFLDSYLDETKSSLEDRAKVTHPGIAPPVIPEDSLFLGIDSLAVQLPAPEVLPQLSQSGGGEQSLQQQSSQQQFQQQQFQQQQSQQQPQQQQQQQPTSGSKRPPARPPAALTAAKARRRNRVLESKMMLWGTRAIPKGVSISGTLNARVAMLIVESGGLEPELATAVRHIIAGYEFVDARWRAVGTWEPWSDGPRVFGATLEERSQFMTATQGLIASLALLGCPREAYVFTVLLRQQSGKVPPRDVCQRIVDTFHERGEAMTKKRFLDEFSVSMGLFDPAGDLPLLEQQILNETRSIDAAVKEYTEATNDMIAKGQGAMIKPVKQLILTWFRPLANAIAARQAQLAEQLSADADLAAEWAKVEARLRGDGDAGLEIFGISSEREAYVMLLLSPEQLSVIAMHHAVSQALIGGGTALYTHLCNEIGEAVQAEVTLARIKRTLASGNLKANVVQRYTSMLNSQRGVQDASRKLFGNSAEDDEELARVWTKELKIRLGGELVTILLQAAALPEIEVQLDGKRSVPKVPIEAQWMMSNEIGGIRLTDGIIPGRRSAHAGSLQAGEAGEDARIGLAELVSEALDPQQGSKGGKGGAEVGEGEKDDDPLQLKELRAQVAHEAQYPDTEPPKKSLLAEVRRQSAARPPKPGDWAESLATAAREAEEAELAALAAVGASGQKQPDSEASSNSSSSSSSTSSSSSSSSSSSAQGSGARPWVKFSPAFVHMLEAKPMSLASSSRTTYRTRGVIKMHPSLLGLLPEDEQVFRMVHPRQLPMLVPPRDWIHWNQGGYLLHKAPMMRAIAPEQVRALRDRDGQMDSVKEALSFLGSVPWKINRKVLTVIEKVWEQGGGLGGIPSRKFVELPAPPPHRAAGNRAPARGTAEHRERAMRQKERERERQAKERNDDQHQPKQGGATSSIHHNDNDKNHIDKNHNDVNHNDNHESDVAVTEEETDLTGLGKYWAEFFKVKQQNSDLHSERSSFALNLQVAREFRNHLIYFPHNLDFRGRV